MILQKPQKIDSDTVQIHSWLGVWAVEVGRPGLIPDEPLCDFGKVNYLSVFHFFKWYLKQD